MPRFRILIQGYSETRCDAAAKDGENVKPCGLPTCQDCLTREFVQRLKDAGIALDGVGQEADELASKNFARIIHEPGTAETVVDDVLTGKREGEFKTAR